MKIVLKENIRGLGNVGDVVKVRDGYARNFLLPNAKATVPSADVIAALKKERNAYLNSEKDRITAAQKEGDEIGDLVLTVAMKANEAGQLFGSVTEAIVAERLSEELGREFKKDQIVLGAHYKRVGEYHVTIRLHSEVEKEIELLVVGEESEEDREDRLAAEEIAREREEAAESELALEDGEERAERKPRKRAAEDAETDDVTDES